MISKSEKSNTLEGIRGIAALIVVFWHSMLGFMPSGSGIFPQWPPEVSLRGSPVFLLLNGSASVVLFFVLSGFVLTASSLKAMNTEIIYRNVVKRWPRLAGPVLCAVLFSYLLFKFNAYSYEDAAKVSQSPWLYKFAYAYDAPFTPHFWQAVRQGLYATFIYGESYYDSSLWTMKYEFIGSFIILAIALVTILTRIIYLPIVMLFILAPLLMTKAASAFLGGISAYYIAFLAGCAMSSVAAMNLKLHKNLGVASMILGFYMLGYAGSSMGIYAPIPVGFGQVENLVLCHTIASVLLLAGTIFSKPIHAALNKPIMKTLGWLSFPIYLIHVPILCSIGAWAYLHAPAWALPPAATGIATTIMVSLFACLPLAIFNNLWVGWVNRSCDMVFARVKTLLSTARGIPNNRA